MTDREKEEPEQDAAILLDQVMRGERAMMFPPGTAAASILVPCFAIGAGAMAVGIGMTVSKTLPVLLGSVAAAIMLTTFIVAGHVLVLRGRPRHRARMRFCVRVLEGCTIVGCAVAAGMRTSTPWLLAPVALISLGVCDLILGSRSYVAFSAFFSLKRQYREDHLRARERTLGRTP